MKEAFFIVVAILAFTIGTWSGYSNGFVAGQDETRNRDHWQAVAGVFIDGIDHNKVYTITPKVQP